MKILWMDALLALGSRRRRALMPWLLAFLLIALSAVQARAAVRQTAAGPVSVEKMAGNLDTPWGLAFLPGGGFLVTERDGALYYFDATRRRMKVTGVPKVYAWGQGGLMDVAAARDFPKTREIFLTYSKPSRGGGGTALAVAVLSTDNRKLENLRVIFEMAAPSRGGRHFGSRVVEARDGTLFLTLGERGIPETAQDLSLHHGKIVRVRRDGSVPPDNPFVRRAGVRPEIWSWGHRNPQGAALDASGALWAVEHGARGGDEINRVKKGANYGWPVISYGRHYWGGKIGEGVAKEGMEQPDFYWDPSIAPCGMAIYSGKLRPAWRGHFFVSSLKFDHISRLDPKGGLREVERLAFPETGRVRDVIEAPDGSLWFLSEEREAVYRIRPVR
ncbi:MAG: PQQ-dependent sugar dehydrogenase [Nitrospinae bacterium]|nr:PQQ-dependent sugar dehydrogenase [Nitrospinota bacterium]